MLTQALGDAKRRRVEVFQGGRFTVLGQSIHIPAPALMQQ